MARIYYNALMYAPISAVPYIICIGFHISQKEDNIQKVEIINSGKLVICLKLIRCQSQTIIYLIQTIALKQVVQHQLLQLQDYQG